MASSGYLRPQDRAVINLTPVNFPRVPRRLVCRSRSACWSPVGNWHWNDWSSMRWWKICP